MKKSGSMKRGKEGNCKSKKAQLTSFVLTILECLKGGNYENTID